MTHALYEPLCALVASLALIMGFLVLILTATPVGEDWRHAIMAGIGSWFSRWFSRLLGMFVEVGASVNEGADRQTQQAVADAGLSPTPAGVMDHMAAARDMASAPPRSNYGTDAEYLDAVREWLRLREDERLKMQRLKEAEAEADAEAKRAAEENEKNLEQLARTIDEEIAKAEARKAEARKIRWKEAA